MLLRQFHDFKRVCEVWFYFGSVNICPYQYHIFKLTMTCSLNYVELRSHNLFSTCLLNTILEEEKKYKNKTPKTILSLGVEVGVVKFLRPNMKMTPTFSTNGYYFIRDLFLALM